MADYTTHTWVNSTTPAINDVHLNEMEAGIAASLRKENNFSDIASLATARTNLGLGTSATRDVGTGSGEVAAGDHTHAIYAELAGATFTGAVITPASASGGAGFRLPHGDAPSSPTNGDVWTTTSAMLVRLNGNSRTLATTTDLASYAALAGATFTGHINVGVGNATYRSRSGGGGGATPYWLTALSTGKALAMLVGTGGTALVYDNSGSFSINSESRAALDGDSTTGGTVRSAWSATGVLTHYNQLFVDGSSDAVQFRLQGTAGQTQDLFRAENSSATVLASINSSGHVTTPRVILTNGTQISDDGTRTLVRADGNAFQILTEDGAGFLARFGGNGTGFIPTFGVFATSWATSTVPMVNKGFAGQTADLQQWQNSSATVLASISSGGAGTFAGLTVSAGYAIYAAHSAGTTITRYGYGTLASGSTGTGNTAIGSSVLGSSTNGSSNTAIGSSAMYSATSAGENTVIGQEAYYTPTGGAYNIAIGRRAMRDAGSNNGNTAVGFYALYGKTTNNNIGIGYYAGRYSTSEVANELFINSLDRTNRAGDIAGSIIYGVQAAAAADQVLQINASLAIAGAADLGGGKGVVYIAEADTVPSTPPTSGFIGYVDPADGNFKLLGSSGTVTTIAEA